MHTKPWAIALILLSTFIITGAQLLYKKGVMAFPSQAAYALVFAGLVCYGLSTILVIVACKGGELSVLYPFLATGFIWISIASPIVFSTDSMNTAKWFGILAVVGGIAFIGLGSRG